MNSLFVAWRSPDRNAGWRPVGQLEYDGNLYRFRYTQGATKPGFQPFSQMDTLDRVHESEDLFPIFANRLLSKSRPEYEEFLKWGGFDVTLPPEPIVILGVTEGLRHTDAIEVFPEPQRDAEGCYLNTFFLHGLRWMPDFALERIQQLKENEELHLLPELQNQYVANAVAVWTTTNDRMRIGYVPRYLAHDVWQILGHCQPDFIRLTVQRVNRDAPLQNRVLCLMRACWPDGFVPCSGPDFQPIVAKELDRCEVCK
jgi:hypothetical protein